MWIERECLGHTSLPHRDEGHGIHETQEPFTPFEQQVEPCIVERFVDPDNLDERREIRSKASDRIEAQAPTKERIRFDQNKGRREQRRPASTQSGKRAAGAGMILVFGIEQGEETGCVHEDRIPSNASSR